LIGRLAALDPAAWTAAEPPPLVLPAAPAPRPRRRGLLVLRPAVALAFAVALVLAGLGGGLLAGGGGEEPAGGPPRPLTAVAGAGTGVAAARGEVRMTAAGAEVHVSGLPGTSRGGYYELWLLNSGDDLVALGSFRVPASGEADVEVPMPTEPARYRYLDVSAEPADGDPAHSGRSVLRASLG
jgi:anti-sigma-K factor RskA